MSAAEPNAPALLRLREAMNCTRADGKSGFAVPVQARLSQWACLPFEGLCRQPDTALSGSPPAGPACGQRQPLAAGRAPHQTLPQPPAWRHCGYADPAPGCGSACPARPCPEAWWPAQGSKCASGDTRSRSSQGRTAANRLCLSLMNRGAHKGSWSSLHKCKMDAQEASQ